MTSPGLSARPPGMFSVVGTTPITRIGASSSAAARSAPITAAPPAMSTFIRSMPSAGLIEMPPVSNVMPLPTSPSTGPGGAPGGLCSITITLGGSALPCATPSNRPMPRARISFSSSTVTDSVVPSAAACGAPRQLARRQHVGRLVAERTREVRALRQHPAAVTEASQRPRRCASARVVHDQAHTAQRARRSAGALLRCPVSCCASTTPSAAACTRRGRASAASAAGTTIAMSVIRRCRAIRAAAEARRRAASGDQRSRGPAPKPEHARRTPSSSGGRPPLLERHASDLPAVTARDNAVRRAADEIGDATSERALEDGKDQQIGFDRCRVAGQVKRGERICGHRVRIMAQRLNVRARRESIAGLRFRDYNANQPHFPRQGRFRCAAR